MRVASIVTVGVTVAAPQQLLGASAKRVAITFTSGPASAFVTDSRDAPVPTGFFVTPQAPVHLTHETHGDIVRHSWFGQSIGGAAQIGMIVTEEE